MRSSIRLNFIIAYVILMISMLFLLNHHGYNLMLDTLIQEKETSLYEEASLISQEYISNLNSLNSHSSAPRPQLRKYFNSLQSLSDSRFWLLNKDGTILIDSDGKENKEGVNVSYFDNAFLNHHTYIGNSLDKLLPYEIVSVIHPLTSNQKTQGYIVLLSSLDELEQKATDYIDNIIICFLIFLIVLFLVFLFLLYRIKHPIKTINAALKEYVNGDFDYKIAPVSGEEYRELSGAIQYLATKTKNMNDYQKKFIANVSHDFRSPLTSIRGYTEAMLDGTIPPEMQEKYLKIILFETNRLSKLTGTLLELNHFENNGLPLEVSTFDINQTIKMTTSVFEQRCKEKRISIELIFSQQALLVDADIDKIEQVIQNLIDNAIKFSHNNSSITISIVESSGKAFISVKDYGIGIPKESIPKIWDRFYKTDLSRGKDKTGTGLGLPIIKEILNAHGENINVISTEGVGTEFTFTLKIHKPS